MLKEHCIPNVYEIHQSLIQSNLISDQKVKKCSSNFIYDNTLRKGSDFKRVSFQCHLHKVCPICKITQQKKYRQQDLKDYRILMDSFHNPKVLRLTFTLRTKPNNNLKKVIGILNKCFNNICKSYCWNKIKRVNQGMFMTKVLEIQTSPNKFNPHLHVHLGFKNKIMTNEEIRKSLRRQWIRETKKFKMISVNGVNLKTLNDESSLDYIRKIEHERKVDHQISSDFFKEKDSEQMKRLKGKNKGKVNTHPEDQEFEEKNMDLSSYSIGKLERINHYYLTQEDFKDPHISHETVQKQLKQLYGYMGQRKTVTTKKTYSKEFKNLKEEKKHEIIQNIH